MPQPRKYESAAERQAAYRERQGQSQIKQSDLACLARSLHVVIETAIEYGTFPLPATIAAATPDQTLKNLIRFFDPIYDPVRNPTGVLTTPVAITRPRMRVPGESSTSLARNGVRAGEEGGEQIK